MTIDKRQQSVGRQRAFSVRRREKEAINDEATR
ncbi:uncharacterized protein G2W53_024990 [Senna tora]|uniref:Uncharacterized protein n=1 Tax=Senna tora TaxID=362788 RepID=A0A834TE99_9FABA|nr:uncharacterized protein G2W53_024990 [Senna tora]